MTKGLTSQEASSRLTQYGPNTIATKPESSLLSVFVSQFKNPLVYILIIVSVITTYLGEITDTVVILTVVIINAIIGTFQELKAKNTLRSLKALLSHQAKVYRDGVLVIIPTDSLVPGDIVSLEAGDRIPADGQLLEARNIQVNESQLTGESYPVSKNTQDNQELFMSSIVTSGRGLMKITKTGHQTSLGQISQTVAKNITQPTPLEQKFKVLSRQIVIVVSLICLAIFLIGLARNESLKNMFEVGVSLGVSAIPEGLPIVVTVTLAFGVYRMSRKKAVMRNLPSVSTLAGVDVICTDKTGTITEGKVELIKIIAQEESSLVEDMSHRVLQFACLCNDAEVGASQIGDLLDLAILSQAEKQHININSLRTNFPRIDDIPFDSRYKYQATLHKTNDKQFLIVKGAFEKLLPLCKFKHSETRKKIDKATQELAQQGFKILLVACTYTHATTLEKGMINDLHFEGILVFLDPLRADVAEAVTACQQAGVKTIMITGDHLETAKTIAAQAGIYSDTQLAVDSRDFQTNLTDLVNEDKLRIIARATPFDKSSLIDLLKKKHHTVAMTGDGVNDAPALVRADIGIAMGKIGTDAAREAADMIILDDTFSTIVKGIFEARGVFENIRKVISYLFTASFGEIFVILVGLLWNLPIPLLAVQILWLNIITDALLDIGIATEANPEETIKKQNSRYQAGVIDKLLLVRILLLGTLMGIGSLLFFNYQLQHQSLAYARTSCLIILAMYQWFHAFNARSEDQSLLRIGLFKNKTLLVALLAVFLLCILAVYNPILQNLLNTQPVGIEVWIQALMISLPIILVEELRKWIFNRYNLNRFFTN